VTILAESAEKRCDIDIERARSALERAQERISKSKEDIDYVRAKAALERALHRIKTAETR
jgi:F-type H+-transporting ATPase subunit epsilon